MYKNLVRIKVFIPQSSVAIYTLQLPASISYLILLSVSIIRIMVKIIQL